MRQEAWVIIKTSWAEAILEQPRLPAVRPNPEVIICQLGSHAAAWGAVQESDLDEERLVNLFDGVSFLGQIEIGRASCRERVFITV